MHLNLRILFYFAPNLNLQQDFMGLFDFLSKGKTSEKPVLPVPLTFFFRDRDEGEGREFMHFDETFLEEAARSSWSICHRVVLESDQGTLNESGNLDGKGLSELELQQRAILEVLEKRQADARLVGRRRLGAEMVLWIMSAADGLVNSILNEWKAKVGASSVFVEELDSGWYSYERELVPDSQGWRQIKDQKNIDQLSSSGSKMEKKHWTEHTVKGDAEMMDLFKEEMKFQGFFAMVERKDALVLERHLLLDIDSVFEVTSKVLKKAEAYEVEYVGWNAPVMREGILWGDCANGLGAFVWANGSVYEGEWSKEKRNGKGRMKFNDGSYHVGDFVNNKRTGYGELNWGLDEYYVGDFVDGEMHGTGTYVWPSGNKYTGNWTHGERVGQGKFWWASGDRYEGEFLNSTRTGLGRYWWTNGDWWVGGFKEGKLHGIGTEYEAKSNSICERIYEMGKMTQELSSRPAEQHEVAGPPEAVPPPIPVQKVPVPTLEELSWTVLDCEPEELAAVLGREAETAAWANKKTFLFVTASWAPEEFDLKTYANHEGVALALAEVHMVVADERYKTQLNALGFTAEIIPTLYALDQDGSKGDHEMLGAIAGWNPENMAVVLKRFFAGEKLKSVMDYQLPAANKPSYSWVVIDNNDSRSLKEIIDAEREMAVDAGDRLYLFIHEAWSPGSVAFKNAQNSTELTSCMVGIRLVELSSKWIEEINEMGLSAWSVPEFFKVSTISGKLTGRRINGGAWGEDTLENIVDVMGVFFLTDTEE